MNFYNDNEDYCCRWLRGLIDAGHLPQGDIDPRGIEEAAMVIETAPRTLLTVRDLAEKIQRKPGYVYTNWRRLVAELGFPAPVPGMGNRWDPVAVDAWLDSQMAPELTIESPIDIDRRKLAARIAAPHSAE